MLEGIWVSSRITRDSIAAALTRHGFTGADATDVINAHKFSDYMLYELVIRNGEWKVLEVPDGLPWGTGWSGTYARLSTGEVVARQAGGTCEFGLFPRLIDDGMEVAAVAGSCGDRDEEQQVGIYEAARFHKVEGEGVPTPRLEATPAGPVTPSGLPSTSATRLEPHPLGSVDGAPLGYLEYLPPDYGAAAPGPLLIAFHGSGQSGAGDAESLHQLYEFGIPPLIRDNRWPDDRPFVVLAPQHEQVFPAACITSAEVSQFITFAVAHYRVDPRRVYLTGLSCGAIGAWNYLGEHPADTVAAAVLISGGGYGAIDAAGCGLGKVPIWAFHGQLDDVVPVRFSEYALARLQTCNEPAPVDARLTVYPDAAHDAWTRTYDLSSGYDIYSWLLSYSK